MDQSGGQPQGDAEEEIDRMEALLSIQAWLRAHPQSLDDPVEVDKQLREAAPDAGKRGEVVLAILPRLSDMATPEQVGNILWESMKEHAVHDAVFLTFTESGNPLSDPIFTALVGANFSATADLIHRMGSSKWAPEAANLLEKTHRQTAKRLLEAMEHQHSGSVEISNILAAMDPSAAAELLTDNPIAFGLMRNVASREPQYCALLLDALDAKTSQMLLNALITQVDPGIAGTVTGFMGPDAAAQVVTNLTEADLPAAVELVHSMGASQPKQTAVTLEENLEVATLAELMGSMAKRPQDYVASNILASMEPDIATQIMVKVSKTDFSAAVTLATGLSALPKTTSPPAFLLHGLDPETAGKLLYEVEKRRESVGGLSLLADLSGTFAEQILDSLADTNVNAAASLLDGVYEAKGAGSVVFLLGKLPDGVDVNVLAAMKPEAATAVRAAQNT